MWAGKMCNIEKCLDDRNNSINLSSGFSNSWGLRCFITDLSMLADFIQSTELDWELYVDHQ
jgi:hypothetical protein